MRYLVTGGSGFIGQKLSGALLRQGHDVIVFDVVNRCDALRSEPGFHFLEGDLCSTESLRSLPWASIDVVCHLAAAGVKASSRHWPLCCRVNVMGTATLLESISNHCSNGGNPPKLLYTKSFLEDHLNAVPSLAENPYIATKAAATRAVEAWASLYPGNVCVAKIYQVFGPSDDAGNVLTYAARQLKAGEPAVFGSGLGRRDWIYIDDFIEGLVACLNAPHTGIAKFDLGRGELISIRDMVLKLASILNVSKDLLHFDPSRDRGDTEIVDRAESFPHGWKVHFSLEERIKYMMSCDAM